MPAASRLRVLLVDDHQIVLDGVKVLLEKRGVSVVACAASGEEARKLAISTSPQIVVTDIRMPGMSGYDLTRALAEDLPKAKVIMLSMFNDKGHVDEARRAGAKGLVAKENSGRTLFQAIETVAGGGEYWEQAEKDGTVQEQRKPQSSNSDSRQTDLTPRELEICDLIRQGRSNKEIADCLRITVRTVETHRRNIMQKLNVHKVTELFNTSALRPASRA